MLLKIGSEQLIFTLGMWYSKFLVKKYSRLVGRVATHRTVAEIAGDSF